jgi:hypothetical protein
VLAWSTKDVVESYFVKATDAFDRSNMPSPGPGVSQFPSER